MKRRTRVITGSTIAAVFLLVVGALVFIAMGAYNVAATAAHTPFVRWVLNTTQERSVAARARNVQAPPPTDSATVLHGFEHYHEMCVTCHGAPGIDRSEIGRGMNPKPPDLAEAAAEWTDRELFWITRHGIKLAGMPAFGITHSDAELWGIVAFLRRLQHMTPGEYQRLATESAARGELHDMDHAHAAGSGRPEDAAVTPDEAVHGMDHGRAAPSAAQVTAHRMEEMDHGAAPRRGVATDQHTAHPAQVDAEATQKLKALVAELLRVEFVRDRISADSSLRRRWENEQVRKQLTAPPQSSH